MTRKPRRAKAKAEVVAPKPEAVKNVRGYLKSLKDDAKDKKSADTLQAVEREHSVPIGLLRKFREGDDTALPGIILNAWNKLLGTDGEITKGSMTTPYDREWYENLICEEQERSAKLDLFDKIQRVRPEYKAALDCWADIVTTGNVGDAATDGGGFVPEYKGNDQKVADLIGQINTRLDRDILPEDQKWMLVRDMVHQGEQFEQVGVAFDAGRPYIARLVNMPTRTMFFNRNADGSIPTQDMYVQRLANDPPGSSRAKFDAWKIVHFANRLSRSNPHGVGLADSGMQKFIQIQKFEESMVIRRLERAPLRLKHILDVSHCNTEQEIKGAVEDYRTRNRKVRTVNNGKQGMQTINNPADEDLIVAKKGKDSPADIAAIDGDPHVGEMGDFDHFFAAWLSCLGPPPEHLGYDSGGQRSVLTDKHIVFARKGRRMQVKFRAGLYHLYWLELILNGVDPRTVEMIIWPPAMATKDELLVAQVQMLKATAIQYLCKAFSTTGKQPSIAWCLKNLLGMDADLVRSLELEDVVQQAGQSDKNVPGGKQTGRGEDREDEERDEEMRRYLLQMPEITELKNSVSFLMEERAIALRKPELIGFENRVVLAAANPFGERFDEVVQSLGVKELHSVK